MMVNWRVEQGSDQSTKYRVISRFLDRDQRLQARDALGPWLRTFTWDHCVTLTFSHASTETTARTRFMTWLRRLEQLAQRSVGWCHALERGAAGRLHFHVLTVGTDHLAPRSIELAWRYGRADAARYDPGRGAAYYLTKGVGCDALDLSYDIAPPSKLIRATLVPDAAGLGDRTSEER